jgi:hypothetical protein
LVDKDTGRRNQVKPPLISCKNDAIDVPRSGKKGRGKKDLGKKDMEKRSQGKKDGSGGRVVAC